MMPLRCSLVALLMGATAAPMSAQTPPRSLEIRYVRDSEEYATLARQVYRMAERAVLAAKDRLGRQQRWAVVLDGDETALDNSIYQLERSAYGGLPFDTASWNAWVAREAAGAVPGAVEFIAAVRRGGGQVAWISGRDEGTRTHTRENLRRLGLWDDRDRLCLSLPADPSYTKGKRRAEVLAGGGGCAWEGQPVTILAYLGDAMGDFPAAGEPDPDAGNDTAFGVRFFLLPNPMYGRWTAAPTRRR